MLKRITMAVMLSACAPITTFAADMCVETTVSSFSLPSISYDVVVQTAGKEASKYDKERAEGKLSPILDTLTAKGNVEASVSADAFMSAKSPVDALKYALEVQQSAIYPVRLMFDIDELLLTKLEPFSERLWKLPADATLTAEEAQHFTADKDGGYYPKVDGKGKITASKELQDKFTDKRGKFNPDFPRNLVPALATPEALTEFVTLLNQFKALGGQAYGYTAGLRSDHVSKALAGYGINFTQDFDGYTQLNLHDFPFHEHDSAGSRKSPDQPSFIEKKSGEAVYGGPTRQFTGGIFFLDAFAAGGCFLKGPALVSIINHFGLSVSGGTNVLVDNKLLNGLSAFKEWTAAGFKTKVVYIPA